jgi:hypothetical protein
MAVTIDTETSIWSPLDTHFMVGISSSSFVDTVDKLNNRETLK